MATKFRKDITKEDIYLASRFKANLLNYCDRNNLDILSNKSSYLQQWEFRENQWLPLRKIADNEPAAGISLLDFRKIVRMIKHEIDTVSEGLIVFTLTKMSLFRYAKSIGGWKTDDDPALVYLERDRLFGGGTIRKRRPKSPAAMMEKIKNEIRKDILSGLTKEMAISLQRVYGLDDLLEEIKTEEVRKPQRWQQIKDQINNR